MSGHDAELLRDAFAAYEAGDSGRFAAFFTDNTLMTGPQGWPEIGPFQGKDEVLRQFERLASDYEEHHFSDLTVVAAERNWVVMEYRWHTRGAASGIETVFDMASAHRMDNGRQAEAHFRWNRAEALEAAGLSE